jgi:hypothetical protein
MADNGPSNGDLPLTDVSVSKERRAFLKRALLAGIPVALATVRPRTTWAQTAQDPTKPGNTLTDPESSCSGSLGSSGCAARKGIVVTHLYGQ